jgi:hypothetical protein
LVVRIPEAEFGGGNLGPAFGSGTAGPEFGSVNPDPKFGGGNLDPGFGSENVAPELGTEVPGQQLNVLEYFNFGTLLSGYWLPDNLIPLGPALDKLITSELPEGLSTAALTRTCYWTLCLHTLVRCISHISLRLGKTATETLETLREAFGEHSLRRTAVLSGIHVSSRPSVS